MCVLWKRAISAILKRLIQMCQKSIVPYKRIFTQTYCARYCTKNTAALSIFYLSAVQNGLQYPQTTNIISVCKTHDPNNHHPCSRPVRSENISNADMCKSFSCDHVSIPCKSWAQIGMAIHKRLTFCSHFYVGHFERIQDQRLIIIDQFAV